jgi:hypothetical protein
MAMASRSSTSARSWVALRDQALKAAAAPLMARSKSAAVARPISPITAPSNGLFTLA